MTLESRAYDAFMGYDQPRRQLNVGCSGCGDCGPCGCWSEPEFYCRGCGAFDECECLCNADPDPDDVACEIDAAQAARGETDA